MALTMIDPASSWFEIVELPLVRQIKSYNINGKELLKAEDVFDKSSDRILTRPKNPSSKLNVFYSTDLM
jgi:hypothetical protein